MPWILFPRAKSRGLLIGLFYWSPSSLGIKERSLVQNLETRIQLQRQRQLVNERPMIKHSASILYLKMY